jgi:hypothetical protein
MQTTDLIRTAVPSKLPDLRDIPLAEMPILGTVNIDEALDYISALQTAPVPVALFSSAI